MPPEGPGEGGGGVGGEGAGAYFLNIVGLPHHMHAGGAGSQV